MATLRGDITTRRLCSFARRALSSPAKSRHASFHLTSGNFAAMALCRAEQEFESRRARFRRRNESAELARESGVQVATKERAEQLQFERIQILGTSLPTGRSARTESL